MLNNNNLVHLIKTQLTRRINTFTNNLWDKFIFLEPTDKSIIHNIIIKCNRNIAIDVSEVGNLMNLLTQQGKLVTKDHYDLHGEILQQDLVLNFFNNIVVPNIPNNYVFKHVGFALHNNLQGKNNIEIRYTNNDPIQEVEIVLNLHIKINNRRSVNAAQAFQTITNTALAFKNDVFNLNRIKTITLDNFPQNGYEVSINSTVAYNDYNSTQQLLNQMSKLNVKN